MVKCCPSKTFGKVWFWQEIQVNAFVSSIAKEIENIFWSISEVNHLLSKRFEFRRSESSTAKHTFTTRLNAGEQDFLWMKAQTIRTNNTEQSSLLFLSERWMAKRAAVGNILPASAEKQHLFSLRWRKKKQQTFSSSQSCSVFCQVTSSDKVPQEDTSVTECWKMYSYQQQQQPYAWAGDCYSRYSSGDPGIGPPSSSLSKESSCWSHHHFSHQHRTASYGSQDYYSSYHHYNTPYNSQDMSSSYRQEGLI